MSRRGRIRRGVARASAHLYAAALHLLPPSFRRDWGAPMRALFARRTARLLRGGSLRPVATWWGRAAVDLLVTGAREWTDARARRTPGWMGGWSGDGRLAVRGLLRSPLWTLTALTTTVVGVGSFTGMVSIAWSSLVRPLPFERPDELVSLTAAPADEAGESPRFNLPLLEQWRVEAPAGMAPEGWSSTSLALDLGDGPAYVDGAYATGGLMELLGVRAVAGRVFTDADGPEGSEPVLMLTEGLWERAFGRDPGVVGRVIPVGSRTYTVVGVVGPEISVLEPRAEAWVSTATFPREPFITVFYALGRRPPGQARSIAERLRAAPVVDAQGRTMVGSVQPLRDALVGDTRPVLHAFLAMVAGLLLVATVNLANLFLARASGRDAVRDIQVALGAGRRRILAGAVLEGGALGLVGGLGGLALGAALRRVVIAASPAPIPGITESGVGGAAAVVALGVSTLACVLLSVWTVGRGRTAVPGPGGSRRQTADRGIRTAQRALTVAQVGATFVLVSGSALLTRTFHDLSSVDPGVDVDSTGGITFVDLAGGPGAEARDRFVRDFTERVAALPGVHAAAAADRLPLLGLARSWIETPDMDPGDEAPMVAKYQIDPSFTEAAGIRVLRGRALGPDDLGPTAASAVVTRTFADRLLGGIDAAVGARFRWKSRDAPLPWIEVVGVTEDVLTVGPTQPYEPAVFLPRPSGEEENGFQSVLFRTAPGQAASVGAAARSALRDINPRAAVFDVSDYRSWLDAVPAFAEARFRMLVALMLALTSTGLALVGVYGVTAYSVRRRRREIGIRMAVGAGGGRVLRSVLAEGLALAGMGVALGVGGAWASLGLLERFLQGMSARDPVTLGVVGGLVLGVASLATLLPALGAARIDPARTLRDS